MIRLSLDASGEAGAILSMGRQDWHYLTQVMRRGPGDVIEVLTDDGQVWTSIILDRSRVQLQSRLSAGGKPSREITLYQALLKGDRFGDVIDRGTQAGIARFVPIITDRAIVRDISATKAARWQAIAKEASEQSRRTDVPEVGSVKPLRDVAAEPGALAFVLDPHAPYDHPWLEGGIAPIHFAVGPEGGFTPEEYTMLERAGFRPLSLGPRVYRAENAGAFAAVLFLQ